MKHPITRVAGIPHEEFIAALEKLGRAVIDILPADFKKKYGEPVDLELVGSHPNNCARLHSDVDLALPMSDWNGQIALRRLFADRRDIAEQVGRLTSAFDETWGLFRTELTPSIPDNKLNTTYATYSVFERKLYNKPADLIKDQLKIANMTQRYVLTPYFKGVPVEDIETALKGTLNNPAAVIAVKTLLENRRVTVQADDRFDTTIKSKPMAWSDDEWAKDGTTEKWRKIYGAEFQEPVERDGQLYEF